jgi:hypothetical protein
LKLLSRRTAASLAAALAIAGAAASAHEDEAAAAARLPARIALLARAQAELEHGDATASLDDFERAAMMLHAADAELGLIRSAMQDGQYRRALAMCAHTAGEHVDEPDGGLLYAWLLRVGGQPALAERVLAQAQAHAGDSPLVRAASAALAKPLPLASGPLLTGADRMAPWPVPTATDAAPPTHARFASNAVLLDDGATALAPLATLPGDEHAGIWVRNALGHATRARIDRSQDALGAMGLVLLKLETPLQAGAIVPAAARDPFAGSPGFSIQFASTADPAWPVLAQGFLGGAAGLDGPRRLGFDGLAAAPGAPVLDAAGRLAGITIRTQGGQTTWLPASMWRATLPAAAASSVAAAPAGARQLAAPDEIYESGMQRALQVLAVDAP